MAERESPDVLARLLGAQRAHQQDQMASSLRDGAETLHAYYVAMQAAGFTQAQAFALTMQWHRLFHCKQFGLPGAG